LLRLKSLVTILAWNVVDDADFVGWQLLNALQDFEATAAALAAQAVRGVGDSLQFVQDELRYQQGAIEKVGFADVGNAAVDENAGVQEFAVRVDGRSAWAQTEERVQRSGLKRAKFARAEHDAGVAEAEQNGIFDERFGRFWLGGASDDRANKQCRQCAESASDGSTEESGRGCPSKIVFDCKDGEGQDKTCTGSVPTVKTEGGETESRCSSNTGETTSEEPNVPIASKPRRAFGKIPRR
jgi:hypothetical protein